MYRPFYPAPRTPQPYVYPGASHIPQYQYRPLAQEGEIRLLRFAPVQQRWRSELSCEMIHTQLSDAPRYKALSYSLLGAHVSGPFAPNAGIWCDGAKLSLSGGMLFILHSILSEYDHQHLWIDTMCIQPNNASERERQVRMMKDVYSKATETIIWLGDARDDPRAINLAFQFLARFHDYVGHIENPALFRRTVEDAKRAGRLIAPLEQFALEVLLRRPWFTRVWVLQEAILSTTAIVRCGLNEVGWSEFCNQLNCLSRADLLDNFTAGDQNPSMGAAKWEQSLTVFYTLSQKVRNLPSGGKLMLKEVLLDSQYLDATDQRDRVYAVLGLCSDRNRFRVRYESTYLASNLFYDITLIFLSQPSSCPCHKSCCPLNELSILGSAGMRYIGDSRFNDFQGQERQGILSLPSWVPIWVPKRYSSMWHTSHASGYNAGGGSVPTIRLSHQHRKLHLIGLVCDQVRQVGRPCPNPPDELSTLGPDRQTASTVAMIKVGQWMREFLWMKEHVNQVTDSPLEDYCRTLCANTTRAQTESARDPPQPTPIRDGGDLVRNFEAYLSISNEMEKYSHPLAWMAASANLSAYEERFSNFKTAIKKTVFGRSLFLTDGARIGLGPLNMEGRDRIVILAGAPVPMVLRPTAVEGEYLLVGDCYLHGMMDGEARQVRLEHMQPIVLV